MNCIKDNKQIYLIADKEDLCLLFEGTIEQYKDCFPYNDVGTVEEFEQQMRNEFPSCYLYKRVE